MSLQIANVADAIRVTKQELRRTLPHCAEVFRDVEAEVQRKVATIVRERDAGEPVVPIVVHADIERGSVAAATIAAIKDRGACIVRRVFDPGNFSNVKRGTLVTT